MEKISDFSYGQHPDQVLDLYWKAGCQLPAPIFVVVPVSGWMEGSEDKGPALEIALAAVEQGFAVASIRCRVDAPCEEQLADIRQAVSMLSTWPALLDPSKIYLIGASAGAHLCLMSAIRGVPCRAVVAICAPVDLTNLPVVRILRPDIFIHAFGGDTPDVLYPMSPAAHVRPGMPPILMVNGVSDPLVPIHAACGYYIAMRTAGNRVQAIAVHHDQPLLGHDPLLGVLPGREDLIARIIDFARSA